MEIKLLFGLLTGVLGVVCFVPYFKDIFKKKTTPHAYSWLIWSILQIIGIATIIAGHGGYLGTLGIGIGALLCLCIFFLSLKYGTKNVTRTDTICFIGALLAIVIWIFMKNPLYSVILISVIDLIGFVPTFRKGHAEPHSETVSLYFMATLSNIFAILALSNYSATTVLYLGSLVLSNGFFVAMLLYRKKLVPIREVQINGR